MSGTRSPSCPPRYATSSAPQARSKPGCAASNTSTPIPAQPSWPAPARMAPELHRPRPCRPQRDPPIGAAHRRTPQPTRHHPVRRAGHRRYLSGHPDMRSRRPDPIRPRVQIRPRCGTSAVALSSGEDTGDPVKHRLDFKATGASTQCCTSRRSPSPKRLPTSPAKPAKAKPDEPTSATTPTESSAECGATNKPENNPSHTPLDKGASDRPKPDVSPESRLGREALRELGTAPPRRASLG